MPSLEPDSLEPEIAGIRPTLHRIGEDFADFVIRDERDRDLAGFVDLVGIESPGLTCSPAIGRHVAGIVDAALGS